MQDMKDSMSPLLEAIDKINVNDDEDKIEVVFDDSEKDGEDLRGAAGVGGESQSDDAGVQSENFERAENERRERKKGRFHPSISTRERKRMQQAQEALTQENQDLRERLMRERQGSVSYYSQALEIQKDEAKKELARSIEDGDSAAQVDWNDRLSILSMKLEEAKSGKYSEVYVPQPQRNSYAEEPVYEPEDDNPAAAEWVEENRAWLDPSSRYYDPELVQFADREYVELRRKLIVEGREDLVDTGLFYQGLSKIIKKTYGVSDDVDDDYRESRQQPAPRQRQRQVVSSVGHAGSPGPEHRSSGGRQISLNAEQRDIAERMIYDRPGEKPLTKQEKYVLYAKQLARLGNAG